MPTTELERQIDGFEALTQNPNWDDEHGRRIPPDLWQTARNVCTEMTSKSLPPVFIGPSGDGTIHIKWRNQRSHKFLLELGRNSYEWSFTDRDGRRVYDRSETLSGALEALQERLL